jgi:hypothetical protein
MMSPGSAPPSGDTRQLVVRASGEGQRRTGYDELDEVVDGAAGLHQHHHPSRLLELLHEFLNGMGSDDGLALGLILEKAVDLGDGSVEGDDCEAVISHVQDQILAHDGQADETEVPPAAGLAGGGKSGRGGFALVQPWSCKAGL